MGGSKKRSPAYPFIDLKGALERAEQFYAKEKDTFVPFETALIDWKIKTGIGAQTVAALRYYGLMQDQGSGSNRKVGLTPLALRIIRDESESMEKTKALQEAALTPKVFSALWELGPGGRVGDETLRTHLKVKMGYLDDAAPVVVKTYRKVLEFSHLDQPDFLSEQSQSKQGTDREVKIVTQEGIAIADGSGLSQTYLEHPILIKGKPTKFSLKIPMPITQADWKRMKDYMDGMIKELGLEKSDPKPKQ